MVNESFPLTENDRIVLGDRVVDAMQRQDARERMAAIAAATGTIAARQIVEVNLVNA